MQLDHEKLDVYAVALDFAVWAYALCRDLKGLDRPSKGRPFPQPRIQKPEFSIQNWNPLTGNVYYYSDS